MTPNYAATVSRVTVNELFGRYTYELSAPRDSNLFILYGDNGSGKTTILRLLFHLLSVAPNRGHRTWIGSIPFRRVKIDLTNGVTITAERPRASTGSYRYEIYHDLECVNSTNVQLEEEGRVADIDQIEEELDELLSVMQDFLGVDIYYIGDDRSVESDQIRPRETESNLRHLRYYTPWNEPKGTRGPMGRRREQRSDDLYLALYQAMEWARRQAIGATNIGSASSSSIYVDVIKRIASAPTSAGDAEVHKQDLLPKIDELEELESEYSPYGLSSGFVGNELRRHLESANSESEPLITEILQPYLESIEARFEALGPLKSRLSTFVRWMDRLLKDKHVEFSLPRGITILTDDDVLLPPEFLSSGEQHLLLLLASTLYAQENPSLFVIDEPELSLNVKWQRQLLEILAECTEDASTQFVLATHSVEILTGHDEHVVRLDNIENSSGRLPV